MPDLTVIEGGGDKSDWDQKMAKQHFGDFVIWLLRNLASGNRSFETTYNFSRFLEYAQKANVPVAQIIDHAILELHQEAFDLEQRDRYELEQQDITQAALQVVAESMAVDNAARARLSKREESLTRAIERKVLGSETRSREHGWSYVENLTKQLGKFPRKRS